MSTGLFKGVLPFSSYFLWTQKGFTRLPLVRGSCHILSVETKNAFFSRHVITGAHIAMPIKYTSCFGNIPTIVGIGERHITAKVLLGSTLVEKEKEIAKSPSTGLTSSTLPEQDWNKRVGRVIGDLNCNYKVDVLPPTTVARLTLKREDSIDICPRHLGELFTPLQADMTPIQPGDELLFVGYDMQEDLSSPHDGLLTMTQVVLSGYSVGAIKSDLFGSVVICKIDGSDEVPASVAGGAVIRKSTGGVVGTIAARTVVAPPAFVNVNKQGNLVGDATGKVEQLSFTDPCVDLSGFPSDLKSTIGENGIAFTPINEYLRNLRKLE